MKPATGNLVIGLPSKGRLQENAFAFFARAGFKVAMAGGRGYIGKLSGIDNVDIAFLSASEIAAKLDEGAIHLGVTGEDLIRENLANPQASVELLQPLGFGHADVVVAVPQSWIDVRTTADLDDVALAFHSRHGRRLRVATKYFNLTRGFFAEHGINDYRIVESLGATEGAPASGVAEAIVDITSSGATLAANNLKVLDDGVILKSQANLVASLGATWTQTALNGAAHILDMVYAQRWADERYVLRCMWLNEPAQEELDRLGQELKPFGFGWDHDGGKMAGKISFPEYPARCRASGLRHVADILRKSGAIRIVANRAEYIFESGNPLFAQLKVRLGA